jgi:hypothetical protein
MDIKERTDKIYNEFYNELDRAAANINGTQLEQARPGLAGLSHHA